MSFNERLKRVMDQKRLSNVQAGKDGGVTHTSIAKYLNAGRLPGLDFLEKFLTVHDDISPQWFILGLGSMLQTKNESKVSDMQEKYRGKNDLYNYLTLIEEFQKLQKRVDSLENQLINLKKTSL